MNLISSEEVFHKRLSSGRNIKETILNDIKSNIQYLMTESDSTGEGHILQERTTKIKNRTRKVICEERLDASMMKGLFNIAQINENGAIEDLALGVENEKGLKINKKLPSLNGETTYFDYYQNKEKTFEEFHYVIKDKSQNILAQTHSTLKQIRLRNSKSL